MAKLHVVDDTLVSRLAESATRVARDMDTFQLSNVLWALGKLHGG